MSDSVKFYTLDEVADMLQVHYQHVYMMVRKGELPAVRIGKLYRIMETDFSDYLVRCRTVGDKKSDPVICSVCGKEYFSPLSITKKCRTCGAPICKSCATIGRAKFCEIHKGSK